MSGVLEQIANAAAANPKRKRACILLWMNGGASQMDTFDLKPGHKNGGSFKEIATAAPGIKIGEHLPKLATFGDRKVAGALGLLIPAVLRLLRVPTLLVLHNLADNVDMKDAGFARSALAARGLRLAGRGLTR